MNRFVAANTSTINSTSSSAISTTTMALPPFHHTGTGNKGAGSGVFVHKYHDHSEDPVDVLPEAGSGAGTTGNNGNNGKKDPLMPAKRGATRQFPLKLYEMLSQADGAGFAEIVGWQPHGRCFVVRNPKLFVKQVMHRFFSQSKLASFQRQLSLYGFVRITQGKDCNAYYHELFLRGRSDLIHRLDRVRVKGTFCKMRTCVETEPDFYAMKPLQVQVQVLETTIKSCPNITKSSSSSERIKAKAFLQTTGTTASRKAASAGPLKVPGRLRMALAAPKQATQDALPLRFLPMNLSKRALEQKAELGRWIAPLQNQEISNDLAFRSWEPQAASPVVTGQPFETSNTVTPFAPSYTQQLLVEGRFTAPDASSNRVSATCTINTCTTTTVASGNSSVMSSSASETSTLTTDDSSSSKASYFAMSRGLNNMTPTQLNDTIIRFPALTSTFSQPTHLPTMGSYQYADIASPPQEGDHAWHEYLNRCSNTLASGVAGYDHQTTAGFMGQQPSMPTPSHIRHDHCARQHQDGTPTLEDIIFLL
ncbi:shock factor protein 4 [Seminavis robusta]|uniref:Shock factor protein 4 n=1 Tax=Seminavis robusta TaxID=568900 RepID=A0A9N8DLJ9_9STRA|nr:shock factor protein 4 [Seminavis robusta]|eukprot:Sro146_g067460.1 shock factor protein 4 (535) ;mRNA; f:19793-21558